MKNVMGQHAWAFEEEKIAQLPENNYSVGIGQHLMRETGIPFDDFKPLVKNVINQLVDGGGNLMNIAMPDGRQIKVYARMRGKAIDLGNRKDCEELGLTLMADYLDANVGKFD